MLPNKSRFVELLICEILGKVKHSGIRVTLATIRERFWLIRGRELVKRIIKKCVICRKAEGVPYATTALPDLPASRVSEESPFTNVRLNFAGPLYVQNTGNQEKSSESSSMVYILLFTCASTRAIHFELTLSLKIPAFLRALKDTLVEEAYPPFSYQIMRKYSVHRVPKFVNYVTDDQITWQFIVEKALRGGGRLIRSLKRPLRKIVGRTNLTYDELQTLVVEIEGILNARLVTYVYDDTESISFSFTPSHLVYGRRITNMPNSERYEIVSTSPFSHSKGEASQKGPRAIYKAMEERIFIGFT